MGFASLNPSYMVLERRTLILKVWDDHFGDDGSF